MYGFCPSVPGADFSQGNIPMKTRNGVSVYRCSPYMEDEPMICDSDDDEYEKNKTVIDDDDSHVTALHVMIYRAVGLDNSLRFYAFNRLYNVVYWVEPGEERRTVIADGFTPHWNQKGTILLESPDDCAYLHVEVQRFNSTVDPGTSNGKVVVGRARIPFPKEFDLEKKGFFPLVRAEGECPTLEGDILVAMKLEKIPN